MKTKHVFVAVLDVNEMFPFALTHKKDFEEALEDQKIRRLELVKFIDILEKNLKQKIFYIGTDIIESKHYERFIFSKNGFLEIMMEVPVAINAHFTQSSEAKNFCHSLKKSLSKILTNNAVSKMLIDSIEVQNENEQSFTYDTWTKLKGIRNK